MYIIGRQEKTSRERLVFSNSPVIHHDLPSCISEARRLAAANPDYIYTIFSGLQSVQTAPPPLITTFITKQEGNDAN